MSLELLKKAWHLSRNDARTDFILDPYRYNDYAFRLEDNLRGLLLRLQAGTYRSQPLLEIDVPKSSLAVRPGTVIEIEDRIVLFAIVCLMAPVLDKKLPTTVYSYRLREKFKRDHLFKDVEILDFPFLKKSTIQKRLQIFEPWYGQWPLFLEQSQFTYERDGYRFLSVTDISAYFENINLEILRDVLLRHLPHEQRIVNLLISVFESWASEALDGRCLGRGIPQGNSTSSFMGNIYLLPLDDAIARFSRNHDIKYYRYMDDVKIFSKDEATARQIIFEMTHILRSLHLNIQGSKTEILRDDEIRDDLEDDRLTRVSECIKAFEGKKLNRNERDEYVERLYAEYKKISKRKRAFRDKDFRLFRRLLTGFTLLRHPKLIDRVLLEIRRNPDYRLTRSAITYLRVLRNRKKIADSLLNFLKSPENVFDQQSALVLLALRYMPELSSELKKYAKKLFESKRVHWYIRSQSILLISQSLASSKLLNRLLQKYYTEKNLEVKRAMIPVLCQLDAIKLGDFVRGLSFDPNPKIGRVGRMLLELLTAKEPALAEINSLFATYEATRLMDSLYKIEIIKHNPDTVIKETFTKSLKRVRKQIKRAGLQNRIDALFNYMTMDRNA